MDKNIENISEVVYPISDATYLAQDMATRMITNQREGRGVRIGLPELDEVVNPFFETNLISVIGRPQNAKTFLSMYILQETMNRMLNKNAPTNEACILVTTEVTVEVAALQWMARASGIPVSKVVRGELDPREMKQLGDSAYKVNGLPLFIIGHSSQRDSKDRRKRPSLTPEVIENGIDHIINNYKDPRTDKFIEPTLIVTDYLQRIHRPRGDKRSKTDFFSDCVDWAKDLAFWASCPHILNVQARRVVDERDVKIPMIGDGEWTANIEQSSDVIFSTHMPKVYNIQMMREFSSWGIPELLVNDNMIYLTLLKQKEGTANKCWVLEGEMGLLKLKVLNLDDYRY